MNSNQRSIDQAIRLVLIAGLAAWCFFVIRPFLGIALWAAILAIGLHPVYLWLKRILGQRSTLAAALLALLGVLIIVGPLGVLSVVIFENIQSLSEIPLSERLVVPPVPATVASLPLIGERLAALWRSAAADMGAVLGQFKPQLEAVGRYILNLSANAGITIVKLLFSMVVAAGFMLNAAGLRLRITKVVRRLAPEKAEDLLTLTTSTLQNVIRGVIGVAVVQTGLVGIGLFAGKIPGAGLLVVLCFVLVLVQLGPTLIAVPTIIYAWMTMNAPGALLFTIWMVLAGAIDNVLKPIWMGKGLPVPILIVFLGVIGGTLTGGIVGLFVGPVVLALGYDLLRLWVSDQPQTS